MKLKIVIILGLLIIVSIFIGIYSVAEPLTELNATARENDIFLSWRHVEKDESFAGYYLYRGVSPGSYESIPITDFTIMDNNFADTSVKSGTTYYYILKVKKKSGEEVVVSQEASATYTYSQTPEPTITPTPTPVITESPDQTTRLIAVPTEYGIYLEWLPTQQTQNFRGYYIYKTNTSGQYTKTPTTDFPMQETIWMDTKVRNNNTYYYIVKAIYEGDSETQITQEVSVTLSENEIREIDMCLLVAEPDEHGIRLEWSPTNESADFIGYYIYRGTKMASYNAPPLLKFPLKSRGYLDTDVNPGKTYYYIIKALYSPNDLVLVSDEAYATAPNTIVPVGTSITPTPSMSPGNSPTPSYIPGNSPTPPYIPGSSPTPTPVPGTTSSPFGPGYFNTPSPTPNITTEYESTLSASYNDIGVVLEWTPVEETGGLRGYYIYKSQESETYGNTPTSDFPISENAYADNKVSTGETYYYIVKALYPDGIEKRITDEVSITVGEYEEPKKEDKYNEMLLFINDPYLYVRSEIDPGRGTVPVIVNSRTLLPVRAIIEMMGGKVGWNDEEKKVSINLNDREIMLWINSNTATVDNVAMVLDVAPQIINSRTMMPIRFIAENFGCVVEWEDENKKVSIYY